MKISDELMLAILAMDAYNRGYNAGITTGADGLGLTGSVGNAQISSNSVILDRTPGEGRAQAASFFAISYSWNGQTVISYRGTDLLPSLLGGTGGRIGGFVVKLRPEAAFGARAANDDGPQCPGRAA